MLTRKNCPWILFLAIFWSPLAFSGRIPPAAHPGKLAVSNQSPGSPTSGVSRPGSVGSVAKGIGATSDPGSVGARSRRSGASSIKSTATAPQGLDAALANVKRQQAELKEAADQLRALQARLYREQNASEKAAWLHAREQNKMKALVAGHEASKPKINALLKHAAQLTGVPVTRGK